MLAMKGNKRCYGYGDVRQLTRRLVRAELLIPSPPHHRISNARIIAHLARQSAQNALTDVSDNVYSTGSIEISVGEHAMNDAMTAAEGSKEESREAQDFVEMGSVSEGTKGGIQGDVWDGGIGKWAT